MPFMQSLNKGFERMIRVRERQSRLAAHAYLATLDDATLKGLGYKRSELEKGGYSDFML